MPQARTLNQILEVISSKEREMLSAIGIEAYDPNLVRNADIFKKGEYQFEPSLDPIELTSALNDDEFRLWYEHKRAQNWQRMLENGIKPKRIICPECESSVPNPESSLRWCGQDYHSSCLIGAVDKGGMRINGQSKIYFNRIRSALKL